VHSMSTGAPNGGTCSAICRIQPPDRKAPITFSGDEKTNTVKNDKGLETSFKKVYAAGQKTLAMYTESLQTSVVRVMSGYNVCICAYGTRTSGNDVTMFGGKDDGDIGVVNLSVATLFGMIESSNKEYCCTLSMCHIASDVVTDLLNPSEEGSLEVRATRQGFYVDDQAYLIVRSEGDTMEYISQGMKVHRALTRQQQTITRPQVLIDLALESRPKGNHVDQITTGSIRFALIESGKEAFTVDTGIRNFTNVVRSLAAGASSLQVPYNGSPLTKLMSQNLGGNCDTTFVLTVDPIGDVDATNASLSLITSAPKIVNKTSVNKSMVASEILLLRKEIRAARAKMQLSHPGRFLHDIDARDLQEFQEKLGNLEKLKESTWEAKRQGSVKFATRRKDNLRKLGLLHVLQEEITINEQLDAKFKDLKRDVVDSLVKLQTYTAQIQKEERKQRKMLDSAEGKYTNEIRESQNKVLNYQKQRKDEIRAYNKVSEELREVMAKVVQQEERKRKTYMMSAEQLSVYQARVDHDLLRVEYDNLDISELRDLMQQKRDTLAANEGVSEKVKDHIRARFEAEKKSIQRKWERDQLRELLVENKFRQTRLNASGARRAKKTKEMDRDKSVRAVERGREGEKRERQRKGA